MRVLSGVLVLVLLVRITAIAQDDHWGVKGGVNLATLSAERIPAPTSGIALASSPAASSPGRSAAHLDLQPEGLFSQQGATVDDDRRRRIAIKIDSLVVPDPRALQAAAVGRGAGVLWRAVDRLQPDGEGRGESGGETTKTTSATTSRAFDYGVVFGAGWEVGPVLDRRPLHVGPRLHRRRRRRGTNQASGDSGDGGHPILETALGSRLAAPGKISRALLEGFARWPTSLEPRASRSVHAQRQHRDRLSSRDAPAAGTRAARRRLQQRRSRRRSTGSAGLTPKRALDARRPAIAAPASPSATPGSVSQTPLAQHQSHHASRRRAERGANAELARPLARPSGTSSRTSRPSPGSARACRRRREIRPLSAPARAASPCAAPWSSPSLDGRLASSART